MQLCKDHRFGVFLGARQRLAADRIPLDALPWLHGDNTPGQRVALVSHHNQFLAEELRVPLSHWLGLACHALVNLVRHQVFESVQFCQTDFQIHTYTIFFHVVLGDGARLHGLIVDDGIGPGGGRQKRQ